MDQGVIASMMGHPLEGAIVLLDPEGQPLAANATARTLDLPRGLQAHRQALQGVRDRVAGQGQGLLPCSVPSVLYVVTTTAAAPSTEACASYESRHRVGQHAGCLGA